MQRENDKGSEAHGRGVTCNTRLRRYSVPRRRVILMIYVTFANDRAQRAAPHRRQKAPISMTMTIAVAYDMALHA